ncbi:MAG: hypothetical protein IKZ43_01830 [Acidaminococcaceae bacterium]|nr:hypothetical protein [Acidaminococcaceae bacterium]
MNKVLCISITALLLAGNLPAFAATNTYTDLDSGFKLKSQPSWMEIGGKSFYGLANKPEKKETSLNIICAYTAKEVEEATGKKFTTGEFLKKYKDLQVLERNELSPDKVNYLLFMPDPYEIKPDNKLALAPKELLDKADISISTNKSGKQPYVYLHIVEKGDKTKLKSPGRSVDMQLAITSANNMLYAVVSTFPLPDLKAQKEKIEEATPFSKKKVRSELTEKNKEIINGYTASRKAFLKGLTFFAPVKQTVPYGFDDRLLGGRIKMPEDWSYVQVNDDTIDKKIPVKITLAMPWNGVSDFLTCHTETSKAINEKDISELNFLKIKEVALFASSRTKDKNTFTELFDSPILTNLIIDKFIKEGLNHPSVKKIVEFKDVKTKSDFGNNYGTIKLSGNGFVKNNYVFNVNANLMFTPQNFGMVTYITKEKNKTSKDMENILKKVRLIKN